MMTDFNFYTDPFFWAMVSMLGMVGATSLFSMQKLRHNLWFVGIVLLLVTTGRFILALPFCPQPRFEIFGLHWIIGGIIIGLVAIIGAQPIFTVKWWAPPEEEGMKLRTTGIYGVVRHPIYLCELLWPLGLAIICRSTYGVALTPLWWSAFFIHALAEEAALEKELGAEYLEYKKKVRGRIIPGLPI